MICTDDKGNVLWAKTIEAHIPYTFWAVFQIGFHPINGLQHQVLPCRKPLQGVAANENTV